METTEKTFRELCTECGGDSFRILHYARAAHHDRLYFQCSACGHFKARVIVHAYVDPDHSYEGMVKEAMAVGCEESGRRALDTYVNHIHRAEEQFKHVLESEEKTSKDGENVRSVYQQLAIREDA